MKTLLSKDLSSQELDPAPDSEHGCVDFSVERYNSSRNEEWNAFLDDAKNSTFLFHRDYMDYHRDRFADHSLMIFRRGRLIAVLPANDTREGDLVSHEGLTYGGLAQRRGATLMETMACFHALLRHLHSRHIPRLLYKQIPVFYNSLPDGDIEYCMFLLGARLSRVDCALVVPMDDRLPVQKRRSRQIHRAASLPANVVEEQNFGPFWEQVLVPRLATRYGVPPVHSLEEIELLASRFPKNIRQYSVYSGSEILAGATIYETPRVAHAQYIAATDKGRKTGALDLLFNWLLETRYSHKACFDFGICNEQEGRALNFGLLDWKEGFGARSNAHSFHEIATCNYVQLEFPVNQYAARGSENFMSG